MTRQLYATCPDQLTGLLAEEIKKIGGKNVSPGYRLVEFEADDDVYYKAHLHLRLASRIYRVIKEVPAGKPQIIYDKVKRIRFHELFKETSNVKINISSREKEAAVAPHLIGSKVREAITDSFQHFSQAQTSASSRDAKVSLNGFLQGKRLSLSLDTALMSLHKRGFRVEGHPAPLKETLAAAMLQVIGYDGSDRCQTESNG